MVLALCSGSTTRFEMGDDYAFTANMSLPTTEDPEETTWRIYDFTTLAFPCVFIQKLPGVDGARWTRSR